MSQDDHHLGVFGLQQEMESYEQEMEMIAQTAAKI